MAIQITPTLQGDQLTVAVTGLPANANIAVVILPEQQDHYWQQVKASAAGVATVGPITVTQPGVNKKIIVHILDSQAKLFSTANAATALLQMV